MKLVTFATQAEAIAADAQVAKNFNMSGTTTSYQAVNPTPDGRFGFPMPPAVNLVHDPVPNNWGGYDQTTETRDPLHGITGYVFYETAPLEP